MKFLNCWLFLEFGGLVFFRNNWLVVGSEILFWNLLFLFMIFFLLMKIVIWFVLYVFWKIMWVYVLGIVILLVIMIFVGMLYLLWNEMIVKFLSGLKMIWIFFVEFELYWRRVFFGLFEDLMYMEIVRFWNEFCLFNSIDRCGVVGFFIFIVWYGILIVLFLKWK